MDSVDEVGGGKMQQALEGITVLDLSQVYQGPYCTLNLAYHGARVIKIESPKGDILRERNPETEPHEFLMFNTNKLGVTLDLKNSSDKEIFIAMVREADILIENFTPGVMERLGLGYEELALINERLIYGSATAYGSYGPYANFPGMDLTVQAIGGVMSSTGYPHMPPVKAGPAIADLLGGTHLLAGVLMALFQRERTGKGQKVEIAMHDTLYPTLASPLAAFYDGNPENFIHRTGNKHSGLRAAPYNVYEVKDGYISIICASDKHWLNLRNLINDEKLFDEKYNTAFSRANNMDSLDSIINEWTKSFSKWELAELLNKNRIPGAPILTVPEVAEDPHLVEREMIVDIAHPIKGLVKVPGSPLKLSNSKVKNYTRAPLLGEHNKEIFQEIKRGLNCD